LVAIEIQSEQQIDPLF